LLVELNKIELVQYSMVTYQFDIDPDTWARWKDTVPRSKTLDERLRELIVADTEGRVRPPDTDEARNDKAAEAGITTSNPTPEADRDRLADALPGSGEVLDARVDAIGDMYGVLREEGAAEKSDLLDAIDVEATGYASPASVWANMVKGRDTLAGCPGVETPRSGMSTWRFTGEGE
jgi:hypothetical protein